MKLLNHLFGSAESLAEEIEMDTESIQRHWNHFLATVSKKREIVTQPANESSLAIGEIKRLLELELVDISGEEKSEEELIGDLEQLEHSEKIRRVHKLEQSLGYAETKYEYVYSLLLQLHSVLRSQVHIVNKILASSADTEKLIMLLRQQQELETEIIGKISKIQTFHSLFLALLKGEHIVKTMDAKEGRLLKKIQAGVRKIFSNEITEGITYEWAMGVFDAIEDKVHGLVADNLLDQHPDMDLEFVNRPAFVELAREVILDLRQRKTSEQMVTVFVNLFREWYNFERE